MTTVRVGTYNVRHAVLDDEDHAWQARREGVVERIERAALDVVGVQECTGAQHTELADALPDYEWVGVADEPGSGEHDPIGYGPAWDCEASETVWLSETGEPGSVGWDAAYPRVLTKATLRDRETDRMLTVFNTHFDHVGQQARLESARQVQSALEAIPGDRPAVLLGDLNTEPGAPAYEQLLAEDRGRALADARTLADQPAGPATTLTDFESIRPGRRIDHVFVTAEWTVGRYRVDATKTDGRYPSDHLPVLVALAC
jgi:endonuclease/exonuclease/phosphatase family metal-dependent hydrolase